MDGTLPHIYRSTPLRGGALYVWFQAMHTRVDLMLRGDSGEEALLRAAGAVRTMLSHLEGLGNCYDPNSELAILNRTASLAPQPVSDELYDMLAFCIEAHRRTGGCFDVTVHSDSHTADTIHWLRLCPHNRTLHYLQPGIKINLSGFLKGCALDRIRPLLLQHGVEDALVNMGNSSVLAMGHSPVDDGWKVGFGPGGSVAERELPAILLRNECLTTSGNDSPGRRHIINPQSGVLLGGERRVAVVTATGAVGEVLSTALFVAGPQQYDSLKAEFAARQIITL